MSISTRIFLILVLIICVSSCSDSNIKTKADGPLIIELGNVTNSKFSDVFYSVEYVKLSLPEHLFMGTVNKVVFDIDRVYVFDYDQSKRLFVFKQTGEYLFSIHQSGLGPSEYQEPLDFIVSNGQIEILDALNKVIVFDNEGQFVRQFRFPLNTNKFIKICDNEYMLYTKEIGNTRFGKNVNCNLIWYSMETRKSECILERQSYQSVPFFDEINIISSGPESTLFSKIFMDSIYAIREKTSKLEYVINFGKNAFPMDLIDPKRNTSAKIMESFIQIKDKAFHYPGLFSNSKFLLTAYYEDGTNFVFLKKEDNTYKVLSRGTKNDVDGGVSLYFIHHLIDDQVISIIDPNAILDAYYAYENGTNTGAEPGFIEFAKSLDINDPPVLVKYHLKE